MRRSQSSLIAIAITVAGLIGTAGAQGIDYGTTPVLGPVYEVSNGDGTVHRYEYWYHPLYEQIYADARARIPGSGDEGGYSSIFTGQEASAWAEGRGGKLAVLSSQAEEAIALDLWAQVTSEVLLQGHLAVWFGGHTEGSAQTWLISGGGTFEERNPTGPGGIWDELRDTYAGILVEYDRYGVGVAFEGHRIRAEWVLITSAGAETLYDGPYDATVGAGVEFTNGHFFNDIQWFDVDIGNSQIKLDNVHWRMNLVPYHFNGLRLTDLDGTLPAFTGVAVNPATNLPINASRVSFTDDVILINFQGISIGSQSVQPTDELLLLDVYAEQADTEPPIVSISSPDDGAIVGAGTVEVTITVQDESATTITSIPAGLSGVVPAGGGTLSCTVTLGEGENTITVLADDGIHPPTGTSIVVIRDTIPPEVTITAPPYTGESPVTVTIQVVDATATEVTCGGTSYQVPAGGGPVTCMVYLPEGENVIPVAVTDAGGNTTQSSVSITYDATAPLVAIPSPADGACFGPGEELLAITVVVDDLTATIVTSTPAGLSGSLPDGGGYVVGTVTLVEGTNVITVSATDQAGRTGSATITVVLDTTAPDVAFISPGADTPVRGTIDVTATVTDPLPGSGVAEVRFYVDDAETPVSTLTEGPFEALLDTRTLADGAHVLRVVASDGKGNSATSQIGIVVDNTAPVAQILRPANGDLVAGVVLFEVKTLDATSGVAAVAMRAGGDAPTDDASRTYDPPVPQATLLGAEDTTRRPDGPLVLFVRATDAAGNEAVHEITITTDNTNPAKAIITPADGSIVSGTVAIQATATDEHLVSIELHVDGNLVATSPSTVVTADFDTTARLDGTMTITAVARDGAGNQSTCTVTVIVDNMALELVPTVINLRNRNSSVPVAAHIDGLNLGLLIPTEEHVIELRVPGGNPVPATQGWAGDDELTGPNGTQLKIRFDRSQLVASIQAGLDGGAIPAGATTVSVGLWVDGLELGTANVRLVGGR